MKLGRARWQAIALFSLAAAGCGGSGHAPPSAPTGHADAAANVDARAGDAAADRPAERASAPDAEAVHDAAVADIADAFDVAAAKDATSPRDAGPDTANPGVWRALATQPTAMPRPLAGFVPYRGSYTFPHSMEWFYVPMSALMSGAATFTFDAGLEPLLNDVASRGHQAVFRVYLDTPSLPTGVPKFLVDGGLLMRPYADYGGGQSPDYESPTLVAALQAFVSALGARYDGDPRIGFITEGLLGFWGEWHTYPHDTWFASVATQNAVLHGFAKAFSRTKLLVRKPSADSPTLPVGYHDDSFAFETLPPQSFNFWPLVVAAGQDNIWKTQPIGGELRPEIQSSVFDLPPVSPDDYAKCVATTHASWLLNQAAFAPSFTGDKLVRALAGAAMLGHDLRVSSARVSLPADGDVRLDLQVSNAGAAPFYYDWPVDVAVLAGDQIVQLWHPDWKLSSILPGAALTLSTRASVTGIATGGPYTVGVRVLNPLANGRPLKFGDAQQEAVWLRLAP